MKAVRRGWDQGLRILIIKAEIKSYIQRETAAIFFFYRTFNQNRVLAKSMPW